jgi:hypothetical protein
MPLWDKLKTELDRAGRAAHSALDEGKLRLEAIRARQAADASAQRLGYAVFRARKGGGEIDKDDYNRFASELTGAQAEVDRLETLLKEAAEKRRGAAGDDRGPGPAA